VRLRRKSDDGLAIRRVPVAIIQAETA